MKKTSLALIIIIPIVFYLLGVFITLHFDIRLWTMEGRFACGFLSLMIAGLFVTLNENQYR